MKKALYFVLTVAIALFILDWGYVNYDAYVRTKDGAEQITGEMSADLTKQTFPYCSGQWPGDKALQDVCNRDSFNGVRAFQQAWSSSPSAMARVTMINCFSYSHTTWGRDWATAGNCAAHN